MNVGEKIKEYRLLNNLTQKELGLMIGFSNTTADSRIRKYEKDLMAPKADIREKLANALDVDISALSDIDVNSYEDVMQILFLLEKTCGLEIERTKEKTYLSFDNNNKNIRSLLSYLFAWYIEKKSLPKSDNDEFFSKQKEYLKWEARFPKDLNIYKNEQKEKLDNSYAELLIQIKATKPKVTRLNQIKSHMINLLNTDLTVEADNDFGFHCSSGLVISFVVSELLKKEYTEYAEFLYDIETLAEYGMRYYIDLTLDESGLKITYTLCWNVLSSIRQWMCDIQEFRQKEANGELSQYEIEKFEIFLDDYLNKYDSDIKKEMEYALNSF